MRALYCYSTHVSDNSIDTHNQIILRGGEVAYVEDKI